MNWQSNFTEGMFEEIFRQSYARWGDPDEALCRRMCEELKAKEIRLRFIEHNGQVRVQMRERNGTMRQGPIAGGKREALVGLARQCME